MNENYSQCRPDTSISHRPIEGGMCSQQIQPYGKCGGRDRSYEGTCCSTGHFCVFHDIWYSQCLPASFLNRKLLL